MHSPDVCTFKLWFGRAFALAADITTFSASTIAAKRRSLERQLDDILKSLSTCPLAQALQATIGRARHQLLTFCDFPGEVEGPTMPANGRCAPPLSSEKSPTATAPCGPPRPRPPCAPLFPPRHSPATRRSKQSSLRLFEFYTLKMGA